MSCYRLYVTETRHGIVYEYEWSGDSKFKYSLVMAPITTNLIRYMVDDVAKNGIIVDSRRYKNPCYAASRIRMREIKSNLIDTHREIYRIDHKLGNAMTVLDFFGYDACCERWPNLYEMPESYARLSARNGWSEQTLEEKRKGLGFI